jgi:hypothetical protein
MYASIQTDTRKGPATARGEELVLFSILWGTKADHQPVLVGNARWPQGSDAPTARLYVPPSFVITLELDEFSNQVIVVTPRVVRGE